MKNLLLLMWLIISLSFWIFTVATTVKNVAFKHYEFRIRSAFYWVAVIVSLLCGIGIGKYIR
jgi:hypothetical protein